MLEADRSRVIVLLGAPGTGKGTQAAYLSGELGIPAFSTGQMLRAEAAMNTSAGFELRQILSTGSLVPDAVACAAVSSQLQRGAAHAGAILDGFPRNLAQARFLDGLLADIGLPSATVIHLQVAHDVLLRRLTTRRQCSRCGAIYNLVSRPSKKGRLCEKDLGALVQRDDDTEGVILHRLDEYDALSAPLLRHYAGDRYHVVDGARNSFEISREILGFVSGAAVMAA